MNTNVGKIATPTSRQNNSTYSIFEDTEEEDEECAKDEDDKCIKIIENPKTATKFSFDAENASLEEIEEIARKHNEKHSDESPGEGVCEYVSALEKEIKEIEKKRCELINDQHYAMLINYANVNELKAQHNDFFRSEGAAKAQHVKKRD